MSSMSDEVSLDDLKKVGQAALILSSFGLTFYVLSQFSLAVATAFAGVYAAVTSITRRRSFLALLLRFSSIPAVVCGVIGRSDYWLDPLLRNYQRILDESNPPLWNESLELTTHPFLVALMSACFITFYVNLNRWPEIKNHRRWRTALTGSAATQCIILGGVIYPSMAVICFSIVIAAVVGAALSKRARPVDVVLLVGAPFYALYSPRLAEALVVVATLMLAVFLVAFKPGPRMRQAIYGLMALLGLILFWRLAPHTPFIAGLTFTASALMMSVGIRWRAVGVELAASLMNLWVLLELLATIEDPGPPAPLAVLLLPTVALLAVQHRSPSLLGLPAQFLRLCYLTLVVAGGMLWLKVSAVELYLSAPILAILAFGYLAASTIATSSGRASVDDPATA